ncbi:hypothetical protein [Stutzerimonas azotifigens]|uniref:Uncharacterized protein n=1 Tax=Stutzerimonas azotifigens TaxID=291995 RepID=A0ABR5Z278_9GAMM|nr:hypothetical protein [Stutzerimonas azotifigens]MBA1274278.1 hypothetical protein [Stutzerimonas azotifigens]
MSEQNDTDRERQDDRQPRSDIPEHMKPENLEKLRDYGKDKIPPGVA